MSFVFFIRIIDGFNLTGFFQQHTGFICHWKYHVVFTFPLGCGYLLTKRTLLFCRALKYSCYTLNYNRLLQWVYMYIRNTRFLRQQSPNQTKTTARFCGYSTHLYHIWSTLHYWIASDHSCSNGIVQWCRIFT